MQVREITLDKNSMRVTLQTWAKKVLGRNLKYHYHIERHVDPRISSYIRQKTEFSELEVKMTNRKKKPSIFDNKYKY